MSKAPKRMLLELPIADEIDCLAMTTPEFEVRKFEYDYRSQKADLRYPPCKGQMILVIRGKDGILLVRTEGSKDWRLPSGRILTYETAQDAVKRVAREECGVGLRSSELAGMYDVVWHYQDVSIKRLHLVYAAVTEDVPVSIKGRECAFRQDLDEGHLGTEVERAALADSIEK